MTLAFIFLLLTLQSSPPPGHGSNQQKAAQKTDVKDTKTPKVPPVTVIYNQQTADQKKDVAKNNPEQRPEKPPWWDVAWSTIALAAIGLATAIVAFLTLRDIKRQTKNTETLALAARDSANTALQNAKAVLMLSVRGLMGKLSRLLTTRQAPISCARK